MISSTKPLALLCVSYIFDIDLLILTMFSKFCTATEEKTERETKISPNDSCKREPVTLELYS